MEPVIKKFHGKLWLCLMLAMAPPAWAGPGDPEVCDGVDNNGNGIVDEAPDADGDLYNACTGDCDDTRADVRPGADEQCNGRDDDCDGQIDDGLDVDHDGIANCFDTETCDGVDNDGDNTVDEGFDQDGDTFRTCAGDCNDADHNVRPGTEESCNGIDDNCDGQIDEGIDVDGDGVSNCHDTEECDALDNDGDYLIDEGFDQDNDGSFVCQGDCDDTNPVTWPGAPELCDDEDNDCNGLPDDGLPDADGDLIANCMDVEECDGLDNDGDDKADEWMDFDHDGIANCFDTEQCDDLWDNDGNGLSDEAPDADGDGISDCHETDPCNGLDDDTDGLVDEGLTCGDETCPQLIPESCLTVWQAHARGFLQVTSLADEAIVRLTNVGPYDVCMEQQAIYVSAGAQSAVLDGGLLRAGQRLSVDSMLNTWYASWTFDNGVHAPHVGKPAWWSLDDAAEAVGTTYYDYLGENLPEALGELMAEGLDLDEDGIEDRADWAGPLGSQAQANVLNYMDTHPVLTAGKLAQPVTGMVQITVLSRNLGALPGSGLVVDVVPEGWQVVSASPAPASAELTLDGATELRWNVNVGPRGSYDDMVVLTYYVHAVENEDLAYAAFDEASIEFDDGEGLQLNVSLPAAAFYIDNNGDNNAACRGGGLEGGDDERDEDPDDDDDGWDDDEDCDDTNADVHPAAEEVCDGVDNNCDGAQDEGFDSDEDGLADCFDLEECDGVDNDGDGLVDEDFDSDEDGLADCFDVEECDGVDNTGNGEIDEGFDFDGDGQPDCEADLIGKVFLDVDGDGRWDTGEPAIAGVALEAAGPSCDTGLEQTLSRSTDGVGEAEFLSVCAGAWTVSISPMPYDVLTTAPSVSLTLEPRNVREVVFGVRRGYITRTQGYWKNHECAITPLLPITMGTRVFDRSSQVVAYFNTNPKGNKTIILGHQLLTAMLNAKAFGSDAFVWKDLNRDGRKETVAEMIETAEYVFAYGGKSSTYSTYTNELDLFNNSGDSAPWPAWMPTCNGGSGGGGGGCN